MKAAQTVTGAKSLGVSSTHMAGLAKEGRWKLHTQVVASNIEACLEHLRQMAAPIRDVSEEQRLLIGGHRTAASSKLFEDEAHQHDADLEDLRENAEEVAKPSKKFSVGASHISCMKAAQTDTGAKS